MSKKNVLIYGATGSIGDSVLNLIRNNREHFNVVGLTCNSNITKLLNIAHEFECNNLGINTEKKITCNPKLQDYTVHVGLDEFSKLMSNNVDIVIFAIAGSSPLKLLIDLLSSGKIIGIANKECIICLGKTFLDIASKFSTEIIPLDSEHNALFQLIKNKNKNSIRKYTITASGGSFFNFNKSEMEKITPDQAILHPKWKMGEKISVDSSTLMNKGLEIIEACILFNINSDNIDAIVHPESIIHGMIEFNDRSSHAFLSQPNMEIAISSVLYEDNIVNLNNYNLDLIKIKSLNFFEIDTNKFKAIKLAKFSLNEGGLLPAVLNYSNELMVQLFLNKKISFNKITSNNELIMNKFLADGCNINTPSIDDLNNLFKIVDSYVLANKSIID
jgi:1-deoxy-D-xylulose-5-phosphate reductoisomerase